MFPLMDTFSWSHTTSSGVCGQEEAASLFPRRQRASALGPSSHGALLASLTPVRKQTDDLHSGQEEGVRVRRPEAKIRNRLMTTGKNQQFNH